jgi:hypothetical protein
LLFTTAPCSQAGDLVCGAAGGMDDVLVGCFARDCYYTTEDEGGACDGDDYKFGVDLFNLRIHCPDFGFATCRDDHCAN